MKIKRSLDNFVRRADIAREMGICFWTANEITKRRDFPKPLKLGRALYWKKADVEKYINNMLK